MPGGWSDSRYTWEEEKLESLLCYLHHRLDPGQPGKECPHSDSWESDAWSRRGHGGCDQQHVLGGDGQPEEQGSNTMFLVSCLLGRDNHGVQPGCGGGVEGGCRGGGRDKHGGTSLSGVYS